MSPVRNLLVAALAFTSLPAVGVAQTRGRCGVVEVVYPDGRPVAGAEVTHHYVDPLTNEDPSGSESWLTGNDGRVCKARLLDPGFLEVHGPIAFGGWCAAFERLRYLKGPSIPRQAPVTRVVLHMRWLHRVRWRGRVVSAEGAPIAGATVQVGSVYPDGTECSEGANESDHTTASDGTFSLRPLPRGAVDLTVKRKGYGGKVFRLALPSPARDLVLEGGAAWTGRVLDPEGKPVDGCHVELRTERYTGISVESGCTGAAFAFEDIPPGDLLLAVRAHAKAPASLAPGRVLRGTVHFAPNERRAEDIRYPAGLDISGQVVDAEGRPVPAAELRVFSADLDKSSAEGTIEFAADKEGRFALHHLEPGAWVVMAGHSVLPETKTVVQAGAPGIRLVVPTSKR